MLIKYVKQVKKNYLIIIIKKILNTRQIKEKEQKSVNINNS